MRNFVTEMGMYQIIEKVGLFSDIIIVINEG